MEWIDRLNEAMDDIENYGSAEFMAGGFSKRNSGKASDIRL